MKDLTLRIIEFDALNDSIAEVCVYAKFACVGVIRIDLVLMKIEQAFYCSDIDMVQQAECILKAAKLIDKEMREARQRRDSDDGWTSRTDLYSLN